MEAPQAARLDQAAEVLPLALRQRVLALPEAQRARIEELRLRIGRPLFVLGPNGEIPLSGTEVTAQTLETVLELASRSSVHTVLDQVKNGFVTIPGGHRLGLCGTAVMEGPVLANLRCISSLCLRVARQFPGLAAEVMPKLWQDGALESTLVLSPPGAGKTTLLRDLIRCLASGRGCSPLRVGLADERGEVAAMAGGVPMLDVGQRCDVMDGCPKAVGMTALLRGMNPQVLAVDEITAPEDVRAMFQAAGCGVKLLATAHGGTLADLDRRPLYRELMARNLFGRMILIRQTEAGRSYIVTDGEGRPC